MCLLCSWYLLRKVSWMNFCIGNNLFPIRFMKRGINDRRVTAFFEIYPYDDT